MHHNKAGRCFSRKTAHRIAMFRNMVDSLMEFESIETTLPKAKELRKYADRVITLGKRGTLHDRRRALTLVRRNEIVQKVFGELAEHFKNRPGGYTRVLNLGPRPSDSAPMAIIQLVDREPKAQGAAKTPAKGNKAAAGAEPAEKKATAKGKAPKKTAASKSKKSGDKSK